MWKSTDITLDFLKYLCPRTFKVGLVVPKFGSEPWFEPEPSRTGPKVQFKVHENQWTEPMVQFRVRAFLVLAERVQTRSNPSKFMWLPVDFPHQQPFLSTTVTVDHQLPPSTMTCHYTSHDWTTRLRSTTRCAGTGGVMTRAGVVVPIGSFLYYIYRMIILIMFRCDDDFPRQQLFRNGQDCYQTI